MLNHLICRCHPHQSLVQTMLDQLHEFCFAIPIYPKPNPWIGCTSSYMSFPFPSMTSSSYPFPVINLHSRETFITCWLALGMSKLSFIYFIITAFNKMIFLFSLLGYQCLFFRSLRKS